MMNWLKKIFGVVANNADISDLQFKMDLVNRDLNKAFNRIERLEKQTRLGKSMRYDEIERARKRRYKKRLLKGEPQKQAWENSA